MKSNKVSPMSKNLISVNLDDKSEPSRRLTHCMWSFKQGVVNLTIPSI